MYFNFVFLAARWKTIISKWEEVEWVLLGELDKKYDPNRLRRKARRILVAWSVIGVISQVLYRISQLVSTKDCWGFRSRLKAYFHVSFPELFAFVPYNLAVASIGSMTSIICDFSRVYLDMLLTTICLTLQETFAILSQRIESTPIEVIFVEKIIRLIV